MVLMKRQFVIELNELLKEVPPSPHREWNGEALNAYAYGRAILEGFNMNEKVHISYNPASRKVVVWQSILNCEVSVN